MHQSNPGVRRRRDSQPSIHFPRSVYLPSIKMGAEGFSKFSLGAKNSSLANSTAPPRRSEARSTSSVKSIRRISHKKAQKAQKEKSRLYVPAENVFLDLESRTAKIDQKSMLDSRSAKVTQQLCN